jgi:hypothetical protein
MAAVSIRSLDVNSIETRAISWARMNSDIERAKVDPPLPPHADDTSYLEYLIGTIIDGWCKQEPESDERLKELKEKWVHATDEERDAAVDALAKK